MNRLLVHWSWPILVTLTLLATSAQGQRVDTSPASNPSYQSTSSQATLPVCINSDKKIADITTWIKNNSKSTSKYEAYKRALSASTDEELLARLVYAEVTAARCPSDTDKVIPQVYSVIRNRIKNRGNDYQSVIFQRDQFSSSLNIYGSSMYRAFLCPDNPALWRKVVEQTQQEPSLPRDAYHYFLYKHDKRWTKAPWGYPEANKESNPIRDCIRTFKNPGWR